MASIHTYIHSYTQILSHPQRLEQFDLSVNLLSGSIPGSLGVVVNPAPAPCDHPGGACFGSGISGIELSSGKPCEAGQYALWYVSGIKQPCAFGALPTGYWCASCEPPYPSGQSVDAVDCYVGLVPLPKPLTPFLDFSSPPYAPAIPGVPGVTPVPGPKLRIAVIPRCTREKTYYVNEATANNK